MHYLYQNVCDPTEDIISHGITEYPERISFINCPPLEHSHVDINFVLNNVLVPANASFTGVLRNPLERQISLYMFRIYRGGYFNSKVPSPEHFRSILYRGELQDYRYWQTQHQNTFLDSTEATDKEWWVYDNIEDYLSYFMRKYNLTEKVPLEKLNASPGNKKDLIPIFYDDKTKTQAMAAFEKDIDLYEKAKSEWILKKTPYRI